ncbi:lysine decarboxylase [Salinibacillus kushneri]|uniref:Lysine decarboxylase n=1 Tax=Salinibacillus kushneri TaxID=237682 RepID=A0A1I0JCV5_9BACI|nr:aminotransferase class V-fold PLP-dependent enzyme [Salinibacillus kushneri]SEU07031.1 lysine decarboxylase [Salinibacillus kushneri]
MKKSQSELPLFHTLSQHVKSKPSSFHVPGHKNGLIFPSQGSNVFQSILPYDLTEITGLDDLHHAESAIKEAQDLTAELYGTDATFFLVGGTTVGNLTMILSVCKPGDTIIVQRNCHKSIMNAIELAGAKPVFVTPVFEEETGRYSIITESDIQEALDTNPHSKAVVLTYPDYFGHTYNIQPIIQYAHRYDVPVLVDEAHGAHFILGHPFPPSAVSLGADIVVQSAHKMLPAMTMASFLHIQSSFVSKETIRHYLYVLQSSSPSYPLMASLDLARYFLAHLSKEEVKEIVQHVGAIRAKLNEASLWNVLPAKKQVDDPLKITLHMKSGMDAKEVMYVFERENVYPELATTNQLLLISGLGVNKEGLKRIHSILNRSSHILKSKRGHDKIEISNFNHSVISPLPYSFMELQEMKDNWIPWEQAIGKIAGETITPYPPGIPILIKGERILSKHKETIMAYIKMGQHIQYESEDLQKGLRIIFE